MKSLDPIADALRRHEAARQQLHALIRRAALNGWSLRRIADVAGMSHEQVRRIIGSEREHEAGHRAP